MSAFPDEIYAAPKSWAEQAYPKLIHYNKLDKGGHFAAWEQPQAFHRRAAGRLQAAAAEHLKRAGALAAPLSSREADRDIEPGPPHFNSASQPAPIVSI